MQLLSVGAELIVAVEHQYILNDDAVGLTVILVLAYLIGPVGGEGNELEVLVLTVNDLAPAGLIQAEDQVAVLLLVGGLHSSGVAGDDFVGIKADVEASLLCLVYKPGYALGGVGI